MKKSEYQNQNVSNEEKNTPFFEKEYLRALKSSNNDDKGYTRKIDFHPDNIDFLGAVVNEEFTLIEFDAKEVVGFQDNSNIEFDGDFPHRTVALKTELIADYFSRKGAFQDVKTCNDQGGTSLDIEEVGLIDFRQAEGDDTYETMLIDLEENGEISDSNWIAVLLELVPFSNIPVKKITKLTYRGDKIIISYITYTGEGKKVELNEQLCIQYLDTKISIHDDVQNLEHAISEGFVKMNDFLPIAQLRQTQKVMAQRANDSIYTNSVRQYNREKTTEWIDWFVMQEQIEEAA